MITLSIPVLVMIVCVLVVLVALYFEVQWIAVVAALVCMVAVMVRCETSPEAIAKRKAEADQAARDAQPHVIREADGCKVYAWKDGTWHYFTRCGVPGTVTTERTYIEKVKCGKNCTRDEPRKEVIVTKEQQ